MSTKDTTAPSTADTPATDGSSPPSSSGSSSPEIIAGTAQPWKQWLAVELAASAASRPWLSWKPDPSDPSHKPWLHWVEDNQPPPPQATDDKKDHGPKPPPGPVKPQMVTAESRFRGGLLRGAAAGVGGE